MWHGQEKRTLGRASSHWSMLAFYLLHAKNKLQVYENINSTNSTMNLIAMAKIKQMFKNFKHFFKNFFGEKYKRLPKFNGAKDLDSCLILICTWIIMLSG